MDLGETKFISSFLILFSSSFSSFSSPPPQELSPPLVDDFLYLCDDAYTHDELLRMEREILHTLNYDINVPVAYRFVRRLARVRMKYLVKITPSHLRLKYDLGHFMVVDYQRIRV